MTTEQMDWIDDQINAGKMKPRGQPWELVGTCDWGDHLAQFKADQLDAWERRLAQFSNRSDSTGYVGRIGVEVLTELRQTREQAEALATRAEQAEARVAELTAALGEAVSWMEATNDYESLSPVGHALTRDAIQKARAAMEETR